MCVEDLIALPVNGVKAIVVPWDAIWLDVSMPDMDGFVVCSELQTRPETQTIPVILLTTKVLPNDRERLRSQAYQGCLLNP